MRKEVLVAITIGFILGLVITFGIWTGNKTLRETISKKEVPSPQVTEEKLPTPTPQNLLVITSPEDNSLSNKEKISVSGKTLGGATVVVLYEEGEKIIEADEQGNFDTEITLVGGANEITIYTYDENGNEVSKTLNVVYSTAEI